MNEIRFEKKRVWETLKLVRGIENAIDRDTSRSRWVSTHVHSVASLSLTLAVVSVLMLAILLPTVVQWPGLVDEIISFLIIGVASHSLGILGHETYHDSFFRSPKANKIFGAWLFHYPLLGRFETLKDDHLRHHRYFGTDQDPDRDHWDWEARSRDHRFHVVQVGLGINFLRSGVGIVRSVFGKTPRGEEISNTTSRKIDIVGVLMCQGVLFGLFVSQLEWWRYFFCWLLPVVTIGALVEDLRVFCEHNEARLRVFRKPTFLGLLIFGRAGFRFHALHHQAPSVPWFALGSKFVQVERRLGDDLDIAENYLTQLQKV